MKISQNSTIVIYGAGEVGNNIATRLVAAGYSVQGFVDANPNCRSVKNHIRVYHINEVTPWDRVNCVIVIGLANGNIHKDVADTLHQNGYQHIVFLPIAHFLSQTLKRKLIIEYNKISVGQCDGLDICEYTEYCSVQLDCREGIIKEDEEYIWTLVPQEILFSENYVTWKGDKSNLTGIMETYDRSIVLRKWYRNLFRYFEGVADYEEYFNLFQVSKSESEKRNIIFERHKLFQLYKMEFNRGLDFFIETAPVVEWNDKGYFNLVGGHHRTIFLLEEGMSKYPAKMTKEDFGKWCNYNLLACFEKLINQGKSNYWDIPIPHPAFSNYIFQRENGKVTILDVVLNYLDKVKTNDMFVLDVSQADGYFARIFSRLDAKKIVCCEPNRHDRTRQVFGLLHIHNVIVCKKFCEIPDGQYDIVFALNPNSFVYKKEEIIHKLLNIAKRYIFLEVPAQDECAVKEFWHRGNYNVCERLMYEVIGGTRYAVYVLMK